MFAAVPRSKEEGEARCGNGERGEEEDEQRRNSGEKIKAAESNDSRRVEQETDQSRERRIDSMNAFGRLV